MARSWLCLLVLLVAAGLDALKLKPSSTTSGPHSPSLTLLEGIKQSSKLEPQSLELTSTAVMATGFASAALSLATFNVLTELINKGAVASGFRGDVAKDLLIFDLRNGYSSSEVWSTLQHWGPAGRLYYLLIELIDVTTYHWGYRAAFLVLLNKMTKALGETSLLKPYSGSLAKLGYFPIILALLDGAEDFFQVLTTLSFDVNNAAGDSGLFEALSTCASIMNQVKWRAVSVGAPVFGLVAATLAVAKIYEFASTSLATPSKDIKVKGRQD